MSHNDIDQVIIQLVIMTKTVKKACASTFNGKVHCNFLNH